MGEYCTYFLGNKYWGCSPSIFIISIIFFIKFARRGSIVAEFELVFTKEVKDPLKPLIMVTKTGKLGNMTVVMKNMKEGRFKIAKIYFKYF